MSGETVGPVSSLRVTWEAGPDAGRRLDRATLAAVLAQWETMGAEQLGSHEHSTRSARQQCRDFEAWLRDQVTPRRPGRPLPDAGILRAAYQAYVAAGGRYSEVARQMGVAQTTAKRWVEAGRQLDQARQRNI